MLLTRLEKAILSLIFGPELDNLKDLKGVAR